MSSKIIDARMNPKSNTEPAAARLAVLMSRSDVQVREILEVVSLDREFAARILRVANSAANATRMPVKTIKDAIVRLGNSAILAMAEAEVSRPQVDSPVARQVRISF